MKKVLSVVALALFVLTAAPAAAKVCFSCKDRKPVPYVCAKQDTFAARHNARKLGCNITSYSTICKCGAWVDHKRKVDTMFEVLRRLGY